MHSRVLVGLAAATLMFSCGGGGGTPATEEKSLVAVKAPEIPPGTAVTITGKVTFSGKAPARRPVSMDATPACARQHDKAPLSEEVVVNPDGTLRNVFVYVKSGLPADMKWPPPAEPVTIDQIGCVYRPHVIGVMVDQDVEFLNNDPTNHNIHPLPRVNAEWNESQPPKGEPKLKSFSKPEIGIPVKCNIHPWMRVYINVVQNPFHAVTGDDGTFTLKGLPPGEYTIVAWHEKYPAQETTVKVEPGGTTSATFDFKD
ncbi:MAG: carboxypeptidase regulatory-like domain-containing protein [Bryobacteraceae bacterium]